MVITETRAEKLAS